MAWCDGPVLLRYAVSSDGEKAADSCPGQLKWQRPTNSTCLDSSCVQNVAAVDEATATHRNTDAGIRPGLSLERMGNDYRR